MAHASSDTPRAFIPMKIAIMTVSDTRTMADDKSGQTLVDRLQTAGHILADRAIVKDDVDAIQAQAKKWIASDTVDVVISTGGTGFTGRDVTPEAMIPLFDKQMDGFSWLFHKISFETIGTSTIQSRATAGLAGSTFIFCIPGSSGACKDAWDGIFVHQLDYRHMPCNFVEIMPRLDEHLKREKARS
nr:molybdenum cofactor biosynthesis protein B [uncultured Cohaesibacter sp.]